MVLKIAEFKQPYKEHNAARAARAKPTGRLEQLANKKGPHNGSQDYFDVERFYSDVFSYALGQKLTLIRDITRAVGFEPHVFVTAVRRGTLTLRQAARLADWADLKLDDYILREFG